MDWEKVVENLREQTKFYHAKAKEWSQRSGYHERVKQYEISADIASILASALSAGIAKK